MHVLPVQKDVTAAAGYSLRVHKFDSPPVQSAVNRMTDRTRK